MAGQSQKSLTTLGEQKPSGPQSASTAQLLAVTHTLAAKSAADARQTHGTLLGQSASVLHASYEQTLMQAKRALRQRPFVPAVQSESCQQVGDNPPPSGAHPSSLGKPGPRSVGQAALIGRWCSGARFVFASPLPPSENAPPPPDPPEPRNVSSRWSQASASSETTSNATSACAFLMSWTSRVASRMPSLRSWLRHGFRQLPRRLTRLHRGFLR